MEQIIINGGKTLNGNVSICGAKNDALPIICDKGGILFVPFVGADDRVFSKGHIASPLMITVNIEAYDVQ